MLGSNMPSEIIPPRPTGKPSWGILASLNGTEVCPSGRMLVVDVPGQIFLELEAWVGARRVIGAFEGAGV